MRTKIIFIVTLIVIGFSTCFAQQQNGQRQRRSPEEMANRQTERMVTDLTLDDKQKADVAAINLKYAKLLSELFQANQGNREVLSEKRKELNTQKEEELRKVITADQFKLYQEKEKLRMEERRQNVPNNPENPQGKRGNQRGTDQ